MRRFDLQRIRIEKNLTQKRVSELTGYPQGFISEIERGLSSAPTGFINKVRDVFGIDNIEDYISEVANIVIREQKKSKSKKKSTDISTEVGIASAADVEPATSAMLEQSNVSRFLDLLAKKERKIEKLEQQIERLQAEINLLKEDK